MVGLALLLLACGKESAEPKKLVEPQQPVEPLEAVQTTPQDQASILVVDARVGPDSGPRSIPLDKLMGQGDRLDIKAHPERLSTTAFGALRMVGVSKTVVVDPAYLAGAKPKLELVRRDSVLRFESDDPALGTVQTLTRIELLAASPQTGP